VKGVLVLLATSTADGDVSKGPTLGPVATTILAKVAWLQHVVIVVVAEFGVEGVAPGAPQRLLQLRPRQMRPLPLVPRSLNSSCAHSFL
jgi:hypothetical protein